MDRRREADPRVAQRRQGSRAVEPERLEVDLNEVRLHPLEVDREARLHERFGEPSRAGVVVREALDVVVERVDASRGDDPGLAHRAAEEVLLPPGALDQLPRAREQGAEWAAEAFREAERDRVEAGSDRRRLDAERSRGVEQPGAVEMHGQPELARGGDDVLELRERPDAPARRCCACSRARRRPRAGRRPSCSARQRP